MREWLDLAVALLLAPTCAACRRPLAHPTRGCVCEACWQEVVTPSAPSCPRCGSHIPDASVRALDASTLGCAHCLTVPVCVDRVRAIGPYAGALKDIVHALKYDGRRSLAAPLARLMRDVGADVVQDAVAAIPVPLHARRRRRRGFNQSADLARHLGLPVRHSLTRVRPTSSQTTLDAASRRRNMHRAFRATSHARTLRGACVLVVDDVYTTGATLEACATTLKDAGVEQVFALTAARVESSLRT